MMTLPPWRSHLAAALHRNRSLPNSRYLQLATVRADGCPANRTVVFRGFADNSNCLKFVTDLRSEKVGQIGRNPRGEACWYFPKTREQFRLSGELRVIGDNSGDRDLDALRHQAWQELSDRAKPQFFWPEPGGERSPASAFEPPDPIPEKAPPPFVLLLLEPEWVDHLQLRGEPQDRIIYDRRADGTWRDRAVNP